VLHALEKAWGNAGEPESECIHVKKWGVHWTEIHHLRAWSSHKTRETDGLAGLKKSSGEPPQHSTAQEGVAAKGGKTGGRQEELQEGSKG